MKNELQNYLSARLQNTGKFDDIVAPVLVNYQTPQITLGHSTVDGLYYQNYKRIREQAVAENQAYTPKLSTLRREIAQFDKDIALVEQELEKVKNERSDLLVEKSQLARASANEADVDALIKKIENQQSDLAKELAKLRSKRESINEQATLLERTHNATPTNKLRESDVERGIEQIRIEQEAQTIEQEGLRISNEQLSGNNSEQINNELANLQKAQKKYIQDKNEFEKFERLIKDRAELHLYFGLINYFTEIIKINETQQFEEKTGVPNANTNADGAKTKAEKQLDECIYFYLELLSLHATNHTTPKSHREIFEQHKDEVARIIRAAAHDLESNEWKTPAWLAGALTAGGLFAFSTQLSFQSFMEEPPPPDGDPPPYDNPPGDPPPYDDGGLEISDDILSIIGLTTAAAAGLVNFTNYGNTLEEFFRLYIHNVKEILAVGRGGFLYNSSGKMVYVSAEKKAVIIMNTIGYSTCMTILLVFAIIAAFTNPLGWLALLFLPLSMALALKFNMDFEVNEITEKIQSKLTTGSVGSRIGWGIAFFFAGFIALFVGYTFFCKIFALGAIPLIGLAVLPLLAVALPIIAALLLMNISIPQEYMMLKWIAIGILMAIGISLAIFFFASPLGAGVLLLLAAVVCGTLAGIVVFKMIANAFCLMSEAFTKIWDVLEHESVTTIAVCIVLGFIPLLLWIGICAFGNAVLSVAGLSPDAAFMFDSFFGLLDAGTILLFVNMANSFILGFRSSLLLAARFLPELLRAIQASDYAATWRDFLSGGYPNLGVAGVFAATLFLFTLPAIPTLVYSVVQIVDSIASGILSFTSLFFSWVMGKETGTPSDKADAKTPPPPPSGAKKAGIIVLKTVAVLTIGLPLAAVAGTAAIIYVATQLVKAAVGALFTYLGLQENVQPKVKPATPGAVAPVPAPAPVAAAAGGTLKQKATFMYNTVKESAKQAPSSSHMMDTLITGKKNFINNAAEKTTEVAKEAMSDAFDFATRWVPRV